MVDTPSSVVIVQGGTGQPNINGLTVVNDQGDMAFQAVQRANGAVVDDTNPGPVKDAAVLAALQSLLALSVPSNTVVTTAITVGTASVPVAAAGSMTRGWIVQNTSSAGTGYIDLCWGETAVLSEGFYRLFADASQDSGGLPPPPPGTPMSAIASIAGQTMTITVFN